MAANKYGLKRYIPKAAQERIRELCGYGCVICGGIPYDYDHFETEFHECTEHDINDIVLLCDKHHREKEAIGIEVIKSFLSANPPQKRDVHYDPTILTDKFNIVWPSINLQAVQNNIRIDGEEVLKITRTGNPLNPIHLDGVFHDDQGGKICSIIENQFTAHQTLLGDVTCVSNRVEIKAASGRTILAFRLEPKNLIIEEIYLVKNRSFVLANQERFFVGNGNHYGDFTNGIIVGCQNAIELNSGNEPLWILNSEIILPHLSMSFIESIISGGETGIFHG